MDLFGYILLSGIYIMVYWLAIDWRNENSMLSTWDFYQYSIAGQFVFGGVVGWYMQSFEFGFVLAVVLSLIYHAH
jgi:hypothetical protein